MNEEEYYCNEWECPFRKNEKCKNECCCDWAWHWDAPCNNEDFYKQK